MSVQLEKRVALLEAEVERLKHQLPNTPAKAGAYKLRGGRLPHHL